MSERRRRLRRWKFSRDGVLFFVGIAGIVYEAVSNHGDRPTLLVLYAAMVGLPAFLRTDEQLQKRQPEVETKKSDEDEPEVTR